MDTAHARRELAAPRLRLRAGEVTMAEAVADYLARNRPHFAPWDPPTPDAFATPEVQAERLAAEQRAFAEGRAFRWWLFLADAPYRVVGSIHFSQISRGAFQCALLGYALDASLQGQGLMHNALVAGLAEVFSPHVNLHRVQAAYRPENTRSAAVLKRLRFEVEGLARDYLFVDGAWRDHCLTALRNPAFVTPAEWTAGSADRTAADAQTPTRH